LGTSKAFLEVGSKSLINRVMDTIDGLFDEIIISANEPEPYSGLPVRVVPDITPGGGALVGLYSSLSAMRTDYGFAVACDMPFLSRKLIKHIIDQAEGYDALVPMVNGYLEPLHAAYSRSCLDAISEHVEKGHRHLRSFYDDVNVGYVDKDTIMEMDPAGLAFFNINTPEQLEQARMLVSSRTVAQ